LQHLSEEQVEHLDTHAREVNRMVDDLVATSAVPSKG
jgi:hypothetical protein